MLGEQAVGGGCRGAPASLEIVVGNDGAAPESITKVEDNTTLSWDGTEKLWVKEELGIF